MNGLLESLKQKKAVMISPLAFILAACGGGGGSSIVSNISDSDSTGSTGDNTGGTPSSTPTISYASKGSLQSTTSSLFDRTLDVNGVKLLVGGETGDQAKVPDEWAHKVAQSYVMLMDSSAAGIDASAQQQMINILAGAEGTWHEGIGTSQRILKGAADEYPLNPLTDRAEGELNAQYGVGTEALLNSIMQDMIWYQNSSGTIGSGDGDIQELFEHALHTLHPWGVRGAVEGSIDALNYTKAAGYGDPHDANDTSWKTSELYLALKEAVDNGVFDPSGYAADPMNNPEDFMKAAIEYTYILNFSMWEMGKEFWLDKNASGDGILEGEWSETANTPAGVLAENPLGYALFNTYFAPVLSKPDFTTLRSMFQDNDGGLSGYQPDAVEAQAMLIDLIYNSNKIDQDLDIKHTMTLESLYAPDMSDTLVQLEII
jgi:hypothetical protein